MRIYVVTHKPIDHPLPPDYVYIQVNAENNPLFSDINDATGEDNIAAKNPYYCELTAAYWIWKNDKASKIVGLAHYRRFFTTNRFSHSDKYYLKNGKVEKILNKYDFIATKLYKTDCTVQEHMLLNVRRNDLELLRGIIAESCPDYLASFDGVMGGRESYLLNMFICKKELWDEYYEWLFFLLGRLEEKIDMTGYSIQEQRLYGFLSERLFTVFVRQNNLTVKSFPTHIVGESKMRILKQKLCKILHVK